MQWKDHMRALEKMRDSTRPSHLRASSSPASRSSGRYAQGGSVRQQMKELASQGRGGDTRLAHIGSRTARTLDDVIHRGRRQVNPRTGLREYMLPTNEELESITNGNLPLAQHGSLSILNPPRKKIDPLSSDDSSSADETNSASVTEQFLKNNPNFMPQKGGSCIYNTLYRAARHHNPNHPIFQQIYNKDDKSFKKFHKIATQYHSKDPNQKAQQEEQKEMYDNIKYEQKPIKNFGAIISKGGEDTDEYDLIRKNPELFRHNALMQHKGADPSWWITRGKTKHYSLNPDEKKLVKETTPNYKKDPSFVKKALFSLKNNVPPLFGITDGYYGRGYANLPNDNIGHEMLLTNITKFKKPVSSKKDLSAIVSSSKKHHIQQAKKEKLKNMTHKFIFHDSNQNKPTKAYGKIEPGLKNNWLYTYDKNKNELEKFIPISPEENIDLAYFADPNFGDIDD